jgi:DUF4097 and DUF4098 domain-containing protein YvlB
MRSRMVTAAILTLTLAGGALAQQPSSPQTPTAVSPTDAQRPREPRSPRRPGPTNPPRGEQKQSEPIVVKLERGGKVAVSNTSGGVTITGWDRDTIEARITGAEDGETVRSEVQGTRVLLSAPTQTRRGQQEIEMEVKVPRYAELSLVEARHGDVIISDVEGSVTVHSEHGDLHITNVGSLRVNAMHGDLLIGDIKGDLFAQTLNGDVTVESVSGLVDAGTTNGDVVVRKAVGNVNVRSASGDIDIQCVKGNADAKTASGSVMLIGVTGDVDAGTASGDVVFKGSLRTGGRYVMKSVSGEVEMTIQPDAPGFTATLQTYNGEIETEFPLKTDRAVQGGHTNRRVVGRYGDGQAQVTLDSFSGSVRLVKGTVTELKECK